MDLIYTDWEKAEYLWGAGQPQGAGRLILEHLPPDARPRWAARILRRVLERSGIVAGPLSSASPRDRSHIERILEIVDNGQWALGHRCFDKLRDSTLRFDEMRNRRGLTQDEETVANVLLLAELVAKVTYNAVDPPDEFDWDSEWYIAPALRRFVDMWKDEEFAKQAWSALSNEG